ncbi:MAG: SpoIID/LytB domain-containing protein [Clostridia bacterium]|nr:SpoIID/LytB domain-containing protein [Clostridia bacterium]
MNKVFKSILSIVLSASLIVTCASLSTAAVSIPEKVRIGLYFTDSATKINTAVTSFNISSVKGVQLGCFKDEKFTVLYEEPSGNAVTIRKDTYYSSVSGKLTEYNPANKTIPQGDKLGPFHIQIGEAYNDLNVVNQQILDLSQKGIKAYPVFVDTWQIWTGFYIDQNAAQADITNNITKVLGNGEYKIIQPAANRIVAATAAGDVVLIFGSETGKLQIHPKADNNPYIFKINNDNKELYRGGLEVRRLTTSDMTLINVIPLEEYLYGVVPSEIESSAPVEAVKAQAVAARTYTIGNLKKYKRLDFDLCTTVNSQVYKGYDGEAQAANKAVDETKGKVVTYNGKIAQVFYFSSSGGRTEDVKNVWGSDVPYLKSVEDKYESGKSWKYTWEYTITAAKVKEIMLSRKFDLGDILSINVTKTSEAGRATELVIKGTKDQRVYTNGNTRAVFSLDSQWYTITTDADLFIKGMNSSATKSQLSDKKVMTAKGVTTIKTSNTKAFVIGADGNKKAIPAIPTTYKFNGKGWGHAIGMSQEGAKGYARQGWDYKKILEHYFAGTKVE